MGRSRHRGLRRGRGSPLAADSSQFISMKLTSIWLLLLGLLLGGILGFFISGRYSRLGAPKGTALLRGFSLAAVAAKAGQTNWQVIEDRIHESFPSLARSQRIARRIVARADMPDSELSQFSTQFQQAASAALVAYGALNTGQFDLVQGSTRITNGSPAWFRLELPRRYHSLGDIHGVADIGYVVEAGHVTVIVSLIEGP